MDSIDSKVQENILDYFDMLDDVYTTYKSRLLECHKVAIKMLAFFERREWIRKANITDTQLEKFGNIADELIHEIDIKISWLVYDIQNHCIAMEKLHEFLEKKKIALEKSCEQINFNEKSTLTQGSAFQPRLSDLLEFSRDGVVFSLAVCAQIDYALSFVNMEEGRCESADTLKDSFKMDHFTEQRIKEILMLTRDCKMSTIP